MLKRTITYKTFDGEEVTDDFYFHLSRPKLVELEVSEKGGLSETLKQLIISEDGKQIMELFNKILHMTIGQKSPDGRRFIQTDEIREAFFASNAYDVFFMELVTNTNLQIEFIQGIVPPELTEDQNQQQLNLVTVEEREKPEPRKLTAQELVAIDADELKTGLASGRFTL